jgi:hypothetical protein
MRVLEIEAAGFQVFGLAAFYTLVALRKRDFSLQLLVQLAQ